ncbi:hypothetical protein EDB83DRAFT_2511645 [Lactarius deliciosus]|nr:hypothetical protein EDB83DRAFT_2511645 [Lactarius deliciosus]
MPLPFYARDDSPDSRNDTAGLPRTLFPDHNNPTSYLRHFDAQIRHHGRLRREAAGYNAREHTEVTQYKDDVPLDVELRTFIPGDALPEEAYPGNVHTIETKVTPGEPPTLIAREEITPTEMIIYVAGHVLETLSGPSDPPTVISYITAPEGPPSSPPPSSSSSSLLYTDTDYRDAPVIRIPDTPPLADSPPCAPSPIREDAEHPGPGWLVYIPGEPCMPHIPTGRGGYKVTQYVHYVIDQFDEPISMGTRGRGQPHYGGTLTAASRPRDHDPDTHNDHLFPLHADYNDQSAINLALTALGDPVVLADVHRLCQSLERKRELLRQQHALELAWKDWTMTAGEVDRRLTRASVISRITPMLPRRIRAGLLPVANPTGDDVERHLGAHHVLNDFPPPVPILRIPNSNFTATPHPHFTMTNARPTHYHERPRLHGEEDPTNSSPAPIVAAPIGAVAIGVQRAATPRTPRPLICPWRWTTPWYGDSVTRRHRCGTRRNSGVHLDDDITVEDYDLPYDLDWEAEDRGD